MCHKPWTTCVNNDNNDNNNYNRHKFLHGENIVPGKKKFLPGTIKWVKVELFTK